MGHNRSITLESTEADYYAQEKGLPKYHKKISPQRFPHCKTMGNPKGFV